MLQLALARFDLGYSHYIFLFQLFERYQVRIGGEKRLGELSYHLITAAKDNTTVKN